MDRLDMLKLAERCEQMPLPSEGTKDLCGHGRLEQEIYAAVRPPVGDAPKYTRSLDAAMTLVPEGWFWRAGHGVLWPGWAHLNRKHPDDCVQGDEHGAHAETSALALCAAALKARANLNDKDGGERG